MQTNNTVSKNKANYSFITSSISRPSTRSSQDATLSSPSC